MRFLRHRQLPSLLCSRMSFRVLLWSTLTRLSMPQSMRMASRIRNNLRSHPGGTHTPLHTHTHPLLMAELRSLAAHVASDARTTIMKSPMVSKCLDREKKGPPIGCRQICKYRINANTHKGSQRFVDPRTYGAKLPLTPPGPPPRASPFSSSWQQISG